MSLVKLYMIKCARCALVAHALGPMDTPARARSLAQKRGWQRLPWIFTQTFGERTREVSSAKEDYCPTCAPLAKAEIREIRARNAAKSEATEAAVRATLSGTERS